MMTRLVHGCNPCPDDARGTHSLEGLLGSSAKIPAATLDLTHLIRRIHDQGPVGTCCGFGIKGAAENCARQGNFPDLEDISALATYKMGRAVLGILDDPEDGSTTAATLEGLERGGWNYEREVPYRPIDRSGGMKLGKGQASLRRAGVKSHRFKDRRGSSLQQAIKAALSSGSGVCGGWLVSKGFENWKPSNGPFDASQQQGQSIGHSMYLLDYARGLPRLVSSWGTDVGDGGIFTVTWDWLMESISLWAVNFIPQD